MTSKNPQLKAILFDMIPSREDKGEGYERLAEAESLVQTYGGIVVVKSVQKRGTPDYRTFLSSGKIEEMKVLAREHGATLLIVNNHLKYGQVYNLSEELRKSGIQVWDRVDLILKIFAKHARTAEAKLEIELASIRHMGPRIYGMGMILSRQGGGTGTRGAGETNTEMMKRHLKEQERKLLERLAHYQQVRELHREGRKRQGLRTVAIVGYTNAGKTSLLNAVTGRKEYAANELFATLDTRVGKLYLPSLQDSVLISDTIGFIRDLPPELVKAFASTLSEAVDADLLLHVVDVTDQKREMKIEVVEEILQRLGLETRPKIYVFNKVDAAKSAFGKGRLLSKYEQYSPVFVSASSGEGLEQLRLTIAGRLA